MNVYIGQPTPQQKTNYVPQMTANTQDGYTATCSAAFTQPRGAFYVSDASTSPDYCFHSTNIGSGNRGWSQIQLPKGIIVNRIEIGARKNETPNNLRPINAFSLKGSNDGSTWTEIKAVSGLGTSWSIGSVQSWNITGQTIAYTYLKLEVQAYSSYVAFDYWNIDGVVDEISVLKNAYIGKVYEYSYDFRNKSSTELSNDGWTVKTGTLETSAYGITAPINYDVRVGKSGLDLSNANKITVTFTSVWSRNDGTGRHIQFGLIDNNFDFQNYANLVLSSGYSTTKVVVCASGTTTDGTGIGAIGQSTYTSTIEIDAVSKTLTGTVPGLGVSTLSLSDAQITSIRGLTGFFLYTTQHTFYLQDMSIVVEY